MKKLLSLLSGMAIVLTFGMALAEDSTDQTKASGDISIRDMIRDDDLQRIILDKDRATLNQMPAETGAEGSAAGGISGESDDMFKDIEQIQTPDDVDRIPAEEGAGAAGINKEPEKLPEKYGY